MSDAVFLDVSHLAKHLGLSVNQVQRLVVRRSDFPKAFQPPGMRRRWRSDEVKNWVDGRPQPVKIDRSTPKLSIEQRQPHQRRDPGPMASFLRQALRQAKRRATKHGRSLNIDYASLAVMYEAQSGRCAVSGVRFSLQRVGDSLVRPYAPSIDRMDSSRGYEHGNVRLVCHCINLMMNEWGASVFHGFMSKLNGSER